MDIRLPIGLLFSILGLLLAGFGILGDSSIYGKSLGVNINLDWGIVLLVFGGVMLWLSRKAKVATHEGSSTEKTAHTGRGEQS
jgi:hypothetical protein